MKQSFISDRTSTNSKTQETIDELDTLTDVDDHLQFATQVIQRDDIPDAVRGKIDQHINHIQKRRNDPNLYLAIIGEFSSGKSTFINAVSRAKFRVALRHSIAA